MALITSDQVAAAYAALATGDRARMLEMWHEDMRWLVPGHNPLSGWKNNVDEFMGFMAEVGRLSDNSFRMDTIVVNTAEDSSADVTHNTGNRAGEPDRRLRHRRHPLDALARRQGFRGPWRHLRRRNGAVRRVLVVVGRDPPMPIISVKVIQGFFTEEQKAALLPALTDAFCNATIPAARPYIYVTVEEVPRGKWALGGRALPDPSFLVNDFVPMIEDAADEFVKVYGVERRRPRGPDAPTEPEQG